MVMTEIDRPTTERRGASFSETIYSNEIAVDGLTAKKANFDNYVAILEDGKIPVVVDPKTELLDKIKPEILIDAVMAKKNVGE